MLTYLIDYYLVKENGGFDWKGFDGLKVVVVTVVAVVVVVVVVGVEEVVVVVVGLMMFVVVGWRLVAMKRACIDHRVQLVIVDVCVNVESVLLSYL
jgi:hypothetical protein